MAVIAREPVASVPSHGNSNHGDTEPPQDTGIVPDPAAPGMSRLRPERKGFLHVVAENPISRHSARFHEQPPANDDAAPNTEPTVIFLYGSTVTGAVLTASQRDVGHYLSEIAFEGTSFAVPHARATKVPGNFGTLTISADGTFSYTRTDKRAGFTDAFTCTSRSPASGNIRVIIEVVAKREEAMPIQHSIAS